MPQSSDANLKNQQIVLIYAILLGLASLAHLMFLSHGLQLVSFDDKMASQGWHDPVIANNNLDLDYSIGRFYAAGKFAFLGWLQSGISTLGHTIGRGLLLIVATLGAACFCAKWTGNKTDAAVAGSLFLAAYPFYESYQAFFSNPLLLLGLGSISISAVLSCRETPLARSISLLLLTLALLCHEMFILFGIMHLALGLRNEGRLSWRIFRRLLPELTIAIAFVTLFYTLHAMAGGTYSGTTLSLDLPAALQSLIRYTMASLPGTELLLDRTSNLPLRSSSEIFGLLFSSLSWSAVFLALGCTFLVHKHFHTNVLPSVSITSSLFLLGLLFLPNLLPAITAKYQLWAMQRRIPYYYGVLGLPFAYAFLLRLTAPLSRATRFAPTLLALGLGLVVFVTQTMNVRVAARLHYQPVDLPASQQQ